MRRMLFLCAAAFAAGYAFALGYYVGYMEGLIAKDLREFRQELEHATELFTGEGEE